MHPVFAHLGPLTITSYGVLLAVAVLVVWSLLTRAARQAGYEEGLVHDLVFIVVIWGIVGARVLFVLLNLSSFLLDPLEIIMIHRGGLAWQGSFLGGILAGIVFLRRRHVPVWKFLDLVAPYIALGHAIGRIGCLLNGCCYGKPVAWGLYFPVWGMRLHPTQIYMSLAQLMIFLLLRFFQQRSRPAGYVFGWYLVLSGLERFLVEFFRADHIQAGVLSVFQYASLAIMMAGAVILLRSRR
ncbi:MAG: prolipoprotein diacylglyceryl transferase [Elusimicrobia bacterium]|nr:prolipoprotein diacylglyceryl transferase [Elusimicrobiota bacterium]